jgi:hypothetical protein
MLGATTNPKITDGDIGFMQQKIVGMEVQILRHQCRAVYFEKKTIKPILHFMKA